MSTHADALRLILSRGPARSPDIQRTLAVSQPTLSRALAFLGDEIVHIGASRARRYALRDRNRGFGEVPVYRVDAQGRLRRLGVLTPLRPDGYLMREDDGTEHLSDGVPWWLLDMRPQGFLGRAYAERYATTLGLSRDVREWNDADALRALLPHGHDVVGNLLLGDTARDRFVNAPDPGPVSMANKGPTYVTLAQQASSGAVPGSSAAGEQPKFTAFAETDQGHRHVLVKFTVNSSNADGAAVQRWRDLLLTEHLALETLREAGISAARSWIYDHGGQRFLEVERFDRLGVRGRRALISLMALDAEFVGDGRSPWPVVTAELARQRIVTPESPVAAQAVFAFGRLIGNTDMHQGNLSFVSEQGRPYALAPAYDMLPMAFSPKQGGAISNSIPAVELHPVVAHHVWANMLVLAQAFVRHLGADARLSTSFEPCLGALEQHLDEAKRLITRLA
ncbi:MAG: type II toxin-antitoxin system HipA family toxin YjjJ [Hydrogenophaga sp.]|nr:type II toxin-antitoxin system HipA family toxin YjjJ [Hydrogenophaga sp.]